MQKWYKIIVLVMLAALLLAACTSKDITGVVVEKMSDASREAQMYVEVNTGSQSVVLRVDARTYMIVKVGERHTFKSRKFQAVTMWTLKNKKGE